MLYKAKAKVAFSMAIMPYPYKTWVGARRRERLLSGQKRGKLDISWFLQNSTDSVLGYCFGYFCWVIPFLLLVSKRKVVEKDGLII